MLKWARENGCPWDYLTCYYAARNRHLEGEVGARKRRTRTRSVHHDGNDVDFESDEDDVVDIDEEGQLK